MGKSFRSSSIAWYAGVEVFFAYSSESFAPRDVGLESSKLNPQPIKPFSSSDDWSSQSSSTGVESASFSFWKGCSDLEGKTVPHALLYAA